MSDLRSQAWTGSYLGVQIDSLDRVALRTCRALAAARCKALPAGHMMRSSTGQVDLAVPGRTGWLGWTVCCLSVAAVKLLAGHCGRRGAAAAMVAEEALLPLASTLMADAMKLSDSVSWTTGSMYKYQTLCLADSVCHLPGASHILSRPL